MSYDLYFKPRKGIIENARFLAHFQERANYTVDATQAWYRNEDTGTYFVFEVPQHADDNPDPPFALNINYFRPSFFALEAEPEVARLVREFDFTVSDPQMGGMGDGEYNPQLFIEGWNRGNRFAVECMLPKLPPEEKITSMPGDTVLSVWRWNIERARIQEKLGDGTFVPKIMFAMIDDVLKTMAVWPDGMRIAVPDVEYFYVPRQTLAPRRLFRAVEDQTLVARNIAEPILAKYRSIDGEGVPVLNYVKVPDDIRKFVRDLPENKRKMVVINPDAVFENELLDHAMRST